ncbi:hypothetical protein WR25_27056 [Diploscapter pachys]|uniref:MSP domain-containing protein n=1 Tax=Diploscapter pachys TaxID=2018661 RepID=A0A2A2KCV1_9BILA|nr:hypothetical protein WR25_27056 [Diploscapter pachys]
MAFIGAIKVDPPTCPITAAGGVSKHTITNMSDVRINGPPKQDKLVFQYAFAEPDVADAATVFANGLPPIELAGETHMKLSAAE